MNEDITFCTDTSCKHRECERHISQIRQHWRAHSFADFDSCEHWQERDEERRNRIGEDTIYRQAAIDEIRKCRFVVDAIEKIRGLPSAEPEIIRCKDCKFWTHIKRTKRHWCKTDDGLYDLNTSADDFCSRAERRTDEPDR